MDGTDLSIAYGAAVEPTFSMAAQAAQAQVPAQPPMVAPAAQSHAQPPEVAYNPPVAMYASAGPAPLYSVTFWDRLAQKKWDVVKMVVLSLIVLLAISLDGVAVHYLSKYLSESVLTSVQEFLVRVSYPIVVVLAIWVIKASM